MSQISIFPANPAVITGSVTVIQPNGALLHTTVDASALPSGASTSVLQTTGNSSLASIDTKTPALGQALDTGSVPVVLTAAQLTTLTPLSTIAVSNFPATQPISAVSLPLPTGAATETTLSTLNTKIPSNLTVTSTRLLVDGSGVTQPVSIAGTVSTTSGTSSTGTISSVSGSASSVTLLASNASRKNAAFYNDSTATLYLALTSSAASTTAYTIQLPPQGYYEIPVGQIYTGTITGIWSSATGAVRVTELT